MTDAKPLDLPRSGDLPRALVPAATRGAERLQDRLAGHPSEYPAAEQPTGEQPGTADEPTADYAALHEHTGRLATARGLADTLDAVLASGAELLGARRGLITTTARGAARAVGLGLDRAGLGALETVPAEHGPFAGLLSESGEPGRLLIADLAADPAADPAVTPRLREVAAQLGLGACYALPLATPADGPLAAAVWFYDQATEPEPGRRRLLQLYCDLAAPLLATQLAADRARQSTEALRRGLLPDRLPAVPGLRLAARCVPAGLDHAIGSDWYDAIALPDGSVGLTVGSVLGDGPGAGPDSAPGAATAMGRLRSALRAYAVLEGEDPVSVLGDLELLLKTTEPTRSATAVYAWVEPDEHRITLAGAGHCPPVLVTRYGANFVETSLSAPLGMLSCWEAPRVELGAERGDLLLLYTEGLARRFGATLHAGQTALRRAAADAPRDVRHDPELFCDHLLSVCGEPEGAATDDLVVLAARFE